MREFISLDDNQPVITREQMVVSSNYLKCPLEISNAIPACIDGVLTTVATDLSENNKEALLLIKASDCSSILLISILIFQTVSFLIILVV